MTRAGCPHSESLCPRLDSIFRLRCAVPLFIAAISSQSLLPRVERMPCLLIELVLQLQAGIVSLYRLDRLHQSADPPVHLKLPEIFRSGGAVTGIMIWKTRVPPDAGVNIFRQILVVLVGTRFLVCPLLMHRIRTRNHHLGSFTLAGMHIHRSFLRRAASLRAALVKNVNRVIMRLV